MEMKMKKEISDLLSRFDSFLAEPDIQRIQNLSKHKNSDRKPSRKGKAITEVKKEKQGRLPVWRSLKETWDMLYNPDSPNYRDDDLRRLIAFKSHLIWPYRTPYLPALPSKTEYHPAYILFYLKIPTKKYEADRDTRERIDEINFRVDSDIRRLKYRLENIIPWIIKKHPQKAPVWLNDIFGYSAWYYGIPQERKSTNSPQYKKSCDLLVRFLNGETYKQLGFKRNTGGNFANRHRPQGALYLLHKIHRLLYGITEDSTKIISHQKREIKEKLTPLPRFVRRKVLEELYTEEFNK